MKDGYIIKFKRPENDFYEYKQKIGGYTENVKNALIYPPNSPEMFGSCFYIKWAHPDWNAEVVDYRNEIGTYISTRSRKHTLKNYLNNILIVLLIPILLPFVGLTKCYHCLKYITK